MKRLFFGFVTLLLLISFSGCANKVHNYAISSDNMLALKTFSNSSEGVKIIKFTDSNKNEATLMCRLSTPVGTPKGETFASYIENAFTKELMVSDMYKENSIITITANLNDIYGSTVLGNAYWKFDITVKSSNGNSYNVNTRYDYESSLSVYSACTEMQRSFVPAVQQLNGEIIKHPKFKNLIQ